MHGQAGRQAGRNERVVVGKLSSLFLFSYPYQLWQLAREEGGIGQHSSGAGWRRMGGGEVAQIGKKYNHQFQKLW